MSKYYYTNISYDADFDQIDIIEVEALNNYSSTGVVDFSLDEAQVDDILGERSYSGADIPLEVIEEVRQTVQASKISKTYYFSCKEDINGFKSFLGDNYNIDIIVKSDENKDWNESWKSSFSPIKVLEKFEIIPSWDENYKSDCRYTMKLYPGMGFGTGNHETTYLCMEHTLEIKKEISSCLDFGCGSGILGIALKILNPKAHVDLYDIDEDAILNCKQNISLNNLDGKFGLYLPEGRSHIERKYDLVFANILENVLILEKDNLIKSVNKGGLLILSGLLKEQLDGIIELYTKDEQLKLVSSKIKGDWSSICFEAL
ncbi:MAG: 50S ribosomal protein L11 methyltransferase [Bacteriovoracaceae bacterium]|jgi:ribosomal protein L11 methyltransferase|nr:50S ribosomal protein L11 methyltransferase [Bacteriovoracaceae bacterium]